MVMMLGKIAIIEAAAIAQAVTFWIKGETGHKDQRGVVIRFRTICDGFGNVVSTGSDVLQIVNPKKFHVISKYLRHGHTLAVSKCSADDAFGSHLLIIGEISVNGLRILICIGCKQLLREAPAGGIDLLCGHSTLFCADFASKSLLIHKFTL